MQLVHSGFVLSSLMFFVVGVSILFHPASTTAFAPVVPRGFLVGNVKHHRAPLHAQFHVPFHATPAINGGARRKDRHRQLHMVAGAVAKKGRYTLTLWPIIQKFKIGPAKAKEIVANVVHVTDKEDILLLCFLAFLISPAAKLARGVLSTSPNEEAGVVGVDNDNTTVDEQQQDTATTTDRRKRTLAKKLVKKEFGELERFGILRFVHQFARVALAVYAVDVLSVILTTIGFTFPTKWHVAEGFAKAACKLISCVSLSGPYFRDSVP